MKRRDEFRSILFGNSVQPRLPKPDIITRPERNEGRITGKCYEEEWKWRGQKMD